MLFTVVASAMLCRSSNQDRAQELAREVTIVRGGGLRAAVGRWMPGGVYNMSINQGWPSGMANTALERGEFAVDEMLGAGNFGQVWAVQHRGQQFALKQVAPDSAYVSLSCCYRAISVSWQRGAISVIPVRFNAK